MFDTVPHPHEVRQRLFISINNYPVIVVVPKTTNHLVLSVINFMDGNCRCCSGPVTPLIKINNHKINVHTADDVFALHTPTHARHVAISLNLYMF